MAITDLLMVKEQIGLAATDSSEDAWLARVIDAVGEAFEQVTGRWLWPRGTATYYWDGAPDPWTLEVPRGVQAVTEVALAYYDQPDDGSGTYRIIPTAGYYLDPPAQLRAPGSPATRISLGMRAGLTFPTFGRRTVKITGTWGPASTPARIAQLATNAVTRAFRARASGGADLAMVGPDGAMKILRDVAPAEMAELYSNYAVGGGIVA